MIRKESSEYVEDGVYYSYKTIRLFGIRIYIEVFTTSNANVLQQFEQSDGNEQRDYTDPVVVTGFIKE